MTPAADPNAAVAFLDAAVDEGRGACRALVTPAGAASYASFSLWSSARGPDSGPAG